MVLASAFAAGQEARVLQDAHVLADGWRGNLERLGQFADRRFSGREPRKDAAADRVGQRPEGEIKLPPTTINHQVNYSHWVPDCQAAAAAGGVAVFLRSFVVYGMDNQLKAPMALTPEAASTLWPGPERSRIRGQAAPDATRNPFDRPVVPAVPPGGQAPPADAWGGAANSLPSDTLLTLSRYRSSNFLGSAPYRRKIKYQKATAVDVCPLIERLSFVKNKSRWGMAFRFGVLEISESDFTVLAKRMLAGVRSY